MGDIATTKLFENEKIAVWEMVLEPGESTGVHTHSRDFMFYVIEGSKLAGTDNAGNTLDELEIKAGSTMFYKIEGDEIVGDHLRAPATHNAVNVGSNRYRELLVEIK